MSEEEFRSKGYMYYDKNSIKVVEFGIQRGGVTI